LWSANTCILFKEEEQGSQSFSPCMLGPCWEHILGVGEHQHPFPGGRAGVPIFLPLCAGALLGAHPRSWPTPASSSRRRRRCPHLSPPVCLGPTGHILGVGQHQHPLQEEEKVSPSFSPRVLWSYWAHPRSWPTPASSSRRRSRCPHLLPPVCCGPTGHILGVGQHQHPPPGGGVPIFLPPCAVALLGTSSELSNTSILFQEEE